MADQKKADTTQSVIEALLDGSRIFPARYLPFFSDISEKELASVREAWPRVSVERKISLLSDLENMMESDYLLSCDALAMFALSDADPQVRSHAVSLLWECDEPRLVGTLGGMLEKDPSDLVQIAAAAGLGRFVLMGALEEIPESAGRQAVYILKRKQSESPRKDVQQEILKSLAYAADSEVNRMIEKANTEPDPTWRLAAVTAMGRTADERWEAPVLTAIDSGILALQNEAVKASGEIELKSARLPLLEMLEAGITDLELRLHVIWALSHIGGEDVRETIEGLLEETDDEEEIEVIEMALEHLDFLEELPDLDLF